MSIDRFNGISLFKRFNDLGFIGFPRHRWKLTYAKRTVVFPYSRVGDEGIVARGGGHFLRIVVRWWTRRRPRMADPHQSELLLPDPSPPSHPPHRHCPVWILFPMLLNFIVIPFNFSYYLQFRYAGCGESRSLMKEVARMVAERREEFGSLKLMFLYRNTERMVASAIGVAEGISVIYYHHSVSYNYRGKLRAWNILHSVHWYLSISPEEPLKWLDSQEDLKSFLESTDRAFLLGEFCGWSPSLMAKIRNNGTGHDSRMQGAWIIPGSWLQVTSDKLF